MKHLYLLCLSALVTLGAHAQTCTRSLFPTMTVIDVDSVVSEFGSYWVCAGRTVEFPNGATGVVETGCTITIGGMGSDLLIKPNCNVTINADATFTLLYSDASSTISDNGTTSILLNCDAYTINYADAPSPGCDISTNIDEETGNEGPMILPNPAHDQVRVHGLEGTSVVRLLDTNGRVVLERTTTNGVLDLDVLPGIYVAVIRTNGYEVVERLVVE